MTQFLRLAATSPVRGLRIIIGPLLAIGNTAGTVANAGGRDPAAPWAKRNSDTALDRVEL